MSSEVLEESDYLQIEPYSAYMRMQVENERTRPFLIRMKAPGRALYANSIPEIKKRTIAEAMDIERKTIASDELEEKKIEAEEKETYDSFLVTDHVSTEVNPDHFFKGEAAVSIATEEVINTTHVVLDRESDSLLSEANSSNHSKEAEILDLMNGIYEEDKESGQSVEQVTEADEKEKQHKTGYSNSEEPLIDKEDDRKNEKTDDTKKSISNDDLWV